MRQRLLQLWYGAMYFSRSIPCNLTPHHPHGQVYIYIAIVDNLSRYEGYGLGAETNCGAAPQSISVPNSHTYRGAQYLPLHISGVISACRQASHNFKDPTGAVLYWHLPIVKKLKTDKATIFPSNMRFMYM